jgi:hypothetical protein
VIDVAEAVACLDEHIEELMILGVPVVDPREQRVQTAELAAIGVGVPVVRIAGPQPVHAG